MRLKLFWSILFCLVLTFSSVLAFTPFTLSSDVFSSGGAIPLKYTHNLPDCPGGDNVNPPLTINSPPNGVGSYVLIMDDLDYPTVHWVVWNIPGSLREIPEDWDVSASGASQGINDMTTPGMEMIESGYAGPCPPMGENHRYMFHLYALEEAFIEDGQDYRNS